MKKQRLRFLIIICIGTFMMLPLAANAALPPSAQTPRYIGPSIPKVITLFEETPLYSNPDETEEPWASVSPVQDVNVLSSIIETGGEPKERTWFKIETTWLGSMWINMDSKKVGFVQHFDSYAWLPKGGELFEDPFGRTPANASLTPQTVHVKASFNSAESGHAQLIDTIWLGEKWLVKPPAYVGGIQKTDEIVELPREALAMEYPHSSPVVWAKGYKEKFIPPQTAKAFEKIGTGYTNYHVKLENGEELWVNKQLMLPEGVEPTEESVKITADTTQYLFPQLGNPTFGQLSPQTVEAYQWWKSPKGEWWYRIHSWNGDYWVKP